MWIDLKGAVNVRDVGGLRAGAGAVRPGRLIRADNLQSLTEEDVQTLLDAHGVRAIADLRSAEEVASEGPGPLTDEPRVSIHHLSLFPEAGENTDVAAMERDGEGVVILPWHRRPAVNGERPHAFDVYIRYLDHRPDSVLAALRLIAATEGATLVHCAAGKDRTGVVVALALAEAGVDRDEIIADYACSDERIVQIFDRLAESPTYAKDVRSGPDDHRVTPETMATFLDAMDAEHGGTSAWLRRHGWTDADSAALRAALLAE